MVLGEKVFPASNFIGRTEKNRLITWRPLLSIPYYYIQLLLFFFNHIHSASLAHYEQKKSGRAPPKMLSVGLRALENVLPCPTRPIYNPGLQIYDPGLRLRAAAAAAEGVGMRRA